MIHSKYTYYSSVCAVAKRLTMNEEIFFRKRGACNPIAVLSLRECRLHEIFNRLRLARFGEQNAANNHAYDLLES